MNTSPNANKDALAGLAFVAIGVVAFAIARNYPFGSSTQMGPGYFPTLLAGVLVLLGIVVFARGLRTKERITASWSPRALVVLTVSVILFALTIPRLGFVPAIAVLVFGSALASNEFRLSEVAVLSVVLTVLTAGLIIFALGMPYPLFGRY